MSKLGTKKALKQRPIKNLVKELDSVFSKYIRMRDKNICFTCGKEGAQAGHYVSEVIITTRWDPDNVFCQCVSCNVFKHGNYPIYSEHLIKKYGLGIIEDLNIRGKQPFKLKRDWLNEMIDYYKKETLKDAE